MQYRVVPYKQVMLNGNYTHIITPNTTRKKKLKMAPCVCLSTPLPSPPSTSISSFISDQPYLSLLQTKCSTIKDLQIIHAQIIKTGLIKHTIAASRLLAFAATSPAAPDLNYALTLFHQIQNPNLFTWNTIIRALSRSSNPLMAVSLFIEMLLHSSVDPERRTYPSVFKAYSELGLPKDGAQLHGRIIKLGLQVDVYIRNSIVHMYANCGCFGEAFGLFRDGEGMDVVAWNSMILSLAKFGKVEVARKLFDEMPQRSSVSWNSMISGYVRTGNWVDALRLFSVMQAEKIRADEFTLVSLLNACANLAALNQGEWVHDYVKKNGIELNVIVITAIINMYCKCGNVERAQQVFESSPTTGLSCWNSMIMGLATNGRQNEAIELFSRLESSDFNPNHVSFIGVLTACSHSGLVKKAEYYFSLMTEKYGIKPSIKHYGCMVDVLGRAGLLREAEMVIKSMPMKPDVVIWGSFLSSCRSYGDVEMGEWASRNLLDLGVDETCGHVLLSNVYAGEGDFEMAIRERMLMKEKGMEKDPGCSLIEVNGEVHEFVAGGTLHREVQEIRSLLENLTLKVRDISFHNHGF